jgi:uncharacterized protein YndB with AHSA1/START domain
MTSIEAPAFVSSVYIRATPEAIWRAITETDYTLRYYYGNSVESDWQPGSTYRMAIAGDLQIEGEVVEADPPRRLVQTFHAVWGPERGVGPANPGSAERHTDLAADPRFHAVDRSRADPGDCPNPGDQRLRLDEALTDQPGRGGGAEHVLELGSVHRSTRPSVLGGWPACRREARMIASRSACESTPANGEFWRSSTALPHPAVRALVPARDAKDDDCVLGFVDPVDDPDVADPQAPERTPGQGDRARWSRIACKGEDRATHPRRRVGRQLPELTLGRWRQVDPPGRLAHPSPGEPYVARVSAAWTRKNSPAATPPSRSYSASASVAAAASSASSSRSSHAVSDSSTISRTLLSARAASTFTAR